ncbi:hypothetical protein EDB92DRAFT_1495622 [Lactarius akahatsu]|uniref:Uncharacterized protein n=1 Tax=Lactarius akahatsu TaxID=416441 RepID=A0AAD4L882_9AGAM|nr:hypothetical protein EDB92DRAFT_1495622 [Lactarius akahatsu]
MNSMTDSTRTWTKRIKTRCTGFGRTVHVGEMRKTSISLHNMLYNKLRFRPNVITDIIVDRLNVRGEEHRADESNTAKLILWPHAPRASLAIPQYSARAPDHGKRKKFSIYSSSARFGLLPFVACCSMVERTSLIDISPDRIRLRRLGLVQAGTDCLLFDSVNKEKKRGAEEARLPQLR